MLVETEKNLSPPGAEQPSLAALLNRLLSDDMAPAILEALGNGRLDATLVRSFLGKAGLSAEHEALLGALLDSKSKAPDAGDQASEQALLELRDLRQVNDTVAAALGACRLCWGGDRRCLECLGEGTAGFAPPDLTLFERLVVPAVRRVGALRRGTERRYR